MRKADTLIALFLLSFVALGIQKPLPPPTLLVKIDIPADSYTFPDIAGLLSKSGMRITCGRSLRDHAAVVHLKDRDISSAMTILANGLDLQFRQTDDAGKSFVMEPSKAVLDRERPWLIHLADEIVKRNRETIQEFGDQTNLSHGAVVDKMIALTRQLKRAEETDPEHNLDATNKIEEELFKWSELGIPSGWFAYQLRHAINRQSVLGAIVGEQPFKTTNMRGLIDINSLRRLHDLMKSEADAEFLKQKMLGKPVEKQDVEEMDRQLKSILKPGPVGYHRLRFFPDSLALTVQPITFGDGKAELAEAAAITPLSDSAPENADIQDYLGKEFILWRTKNRAFSADALKRLPASTPIPVNDRGSTTTLGQVALRWAEVTRQEIVMELYPFREYVSLPPVERITRKGAVIPAVHTTNLKDALSNKGWFVNVNDGVALICNEWACVDRYRDWPFAVLLQLAKRNISDDPLKPWLTKISFEDAMAFHKLISDVENARLSDLTSFQGLILAEITDFHPAAFVLSLMNKPERDRFLLSAYKTGTGRINLARCGPVIIQRIASAMREMEVTAKYSGDTEDAIQDDFADRLSEMELVFTRDIKSTNDFLTVSIEQVGVRENNQKTYINLPLKHFQLPKPN